MEVGAMIETVDAVDAIAEIVAVADFLSIGCNDLSASFVGRHRHEATEMPLYFDPRVLRAVRRVLEEASGASKSVGICGEMPSDAFAIVLLVGLGATEISVPPIWVPFIRHAINCIDPIVATRTVQRALSACGARDVVKIVHGDFVGVLGELWSLQGAQWMRNSESNVSSSSSD
ncbi:MAG: putative PEP-binding protein [Polyangiales bacterium]